MTTSPAHETGIRFGIRWCPTCDTAEAHCRFDRTTTETIPAECVGIEIRSATWGCWMVCPCGVEGPKRHGEPDDAWAAADDDRARHLAGIPLDIDVVDLTTAAAKLAEVPLGG